jgi:hypothetical protein
VTLATHEKRRIKNREEMGRLLTHVRIVGQGKEKQTTSALCVSSWFVGREKIHHSKGKLQLNIESDWLLSYSHLASAAF